MPRSRKYRTSLVRRVAATQGAWWGETFSRRSISGLPFAGRVNFALAHDFLGAEVLPVEVLVRAIVGAHRRSVQRNTSEDAASPRPGENLGLHDDIGLGRRGSAHRTRGRGSVSAELDLARHHRLGASFIHDEQHKIGRLAADLKSETAPFEGKHRRSAPWPAEVMSGAARDHSPSVAASDYKCSFLHGWKDDNAFRLVQQIAGNPCVRHAQDFLQYRVRFRQAVIFLLLGNDRNTNEQTHRHQGMFFH